MNPRTSLSDLVARLESADHTIAYFNKPLPEPLLDGLRLLARRRGRGSVDLVAEQIDDVAYLKKLKGKKKQGQAFYSCESGHRSG